MTKINKKIALKLIKKLPFSKERKEEIRIEVEKELERIKDFNREALQNELNREKIQ